MTGKIASNGTGADLILLYDGLCPICGREVAWLRSRNKLQKLAFQDIHAEDFNPVDYGTTLERLMAEIHGILPDGRMIHGMDVFYHAYRAVGLGWLLAPTRWPLLRPLFNSLYALFARHRLRLGSWLSGKPCRSSHCQLSHTQHD